MERRFFTDDSFEQFLRETTENFRMYPQRKVWYSIYNNLHPSKKWPSLSVLLLLISSVMFIGVSNKKHVIVVESKIAVPYITVENNTASNSTSSIQITESTQQPDQYASFKTNDLNTVVMNEELIQSSAIVNTTQYFNLASSPRVAINVSSPTVRYYSDELSGNSLTSADIPTENIAATDVDLSDLNQLEAITDLTEEDITKEEITPEVKLPKKKKGDNRFAMHMYVTPSFGYRSMKSNEHFNARTAMPMSLVALPNQPQATMSHNAAMGIELGGGIYYNINKSLRLKAGLQLNFTNYRIHAYGLSHATMATVIMNGPDVNSPDLRSMQTQISNVGGYEQITLNSNTFQMSIPVGADYLIAKNDRVKWYAGASVQPTYIAGGNAFMISADKNHYIADATILRKFNLNGALETFISYQPVNGVTVNVGPQLRYQFLSTYVKEYPMTENLYNIGIKLGITTRF